MENNKTDGYGAFVKVRGDTRSLMLKISGVHCAGCIQKIESTLNDDASITHARLNFTTGALSVEWVGDMNKANDIVTQIAGLGYGVSPYQSNESDQDSQSRFLLMCLGVSGFAAGNIMLLSFGLWITNQNTMGFATREFLHLISALIAVPAILFSGRPFFRSAWQALKNKRTNMDVPISLALILATGMSLHEVARGAEHVYFDSALMLCFFLLIGRYLDFRARKNARSAATDLMSTLSGFATVIDGDKHRQIPIRDVKPDMIVAVAMGEKFPTDGVIIMGETDIDTSLVTGETMPRLAGPQSDVYAGTLNLSAPVQIRVAKAAEDSLLADIVRLMEKAEQSQAAYTHLADRAASLYTPIVHTLAIAAFVLWFFILGAPWQVALMVSVTMLIITCPCALGLAVPVAQVLATGHLIKNGILVKSGDALERLATITHIFLDKTGTITTGQPRLVNTPSADSLQLAASIAQQSRHPLSRALTKAYDGALVKIDNVEEITGKGLQGIYQGQSIRLGSERWIMPDAPQRSPQTHTHLWLAVADHDPVCFELSDTVRSNAHAVIQSLKNKGLSVTILSGDRDAVVQTIARDVGVDDAYGDLTPTDKYAFLEKARANGAKVMMIGDGLNDAPILAGADLSIAPGSAIDMAQNAADIIFMGDDFQSIDKVYRMATKTQRIIRQNFTLAILYNIFAIPLAFMGMVTPMIAAIAMSGSSLIVIANSFRLRSKL